MAEKQVAENVVLVGKKPAMSYVLACVTQFNNGKNEVVLRARGRAISHAVDVAEMVRNKFLTDVKVKDIKISTEEGGSEDGGKMNVSAIEIVLSK